MEETWLFNNITELDMTNIGEIHAHIVHLTYLSIEHMSTV